MSYIIPIGDESFMSAKMGGSVWVLWFVTWSHKILLVDNDRIPGTGISNIRFVPQWILWPNNFEWAIFSVLPREDTSGSAFQFCLCWKGSSNHTVDAMSIQLTVHCDRRTPPKCSIRGLSVQPISSNINCAVTEKAAGQRHSRWRNSRSSGELGRGGGGGGSRVHHFEDERRCVEVINLSDPHGAEFATQQKKQIMWEKYVSHIWKKK
jgi:hypothetical protein